MNFIDTINSVELVLAAKQVPVVVGESGIGKTSLVHELAKKHAWQVVTIDGNLLKEGEIGGLPTVLTKGQDRPLTVYALHSSLQRVADIADKGQTVLLFIDEINRCDHAVQQELMNIILNREINGFVLPEVVHIIAAMNPPDSEDYRTVDMDVAQQNRFVWLYMETDYLQWLDWAQRVSIDKDIMTFIATYPEYLLHHNEEDLTATPRSYERVSQVWSLYKAQPNVWSQAVLQNVFRGNIGKSLAGELMAFLKSDRKPLLTYEDIFEKPARQDWQEVLFSESQPRLYLTAKHVCRRLELIMGQALDENKRQTLVERLLMFLKVYPKDMRLGIMKDIRNRLPSLYKVLWQEKDFVDLYFAMYRESR